VIRKCMAAAVAMTLAITAALSVASPAQAADYTGKLPSKVKGCNKNFRVGTKVNIYDFTYNRAKPKAKLVKVRLMGTAEWRYSK
jgi:hypothetical protein